MSIWDLRMWIESHIPVWVPLAVAAAALLWLAITTKGRTRKPRP